MNYDVFVSYAHADNDGAWIDIFASSLVSTYQKLTGGAPSVFLDKESLITSDVWERKIKGALTRSTLLLAVVSPSYVRSPWCRKEWMLFCEREKDLRDRRILADEQGLIFPILLYPLDRGRFDQEQTEFANTIKRRQWMDVSSQVDGTPIRPQQVRELAESLIDVDSETKIRRRNVAAHVNPAKTSSNTIRDTLAGLEWTAELSSEELSFEEAREYVERLDAQGGGAWRLPTRQELQTIIDPASMDENPDAAPFPLKPPFNAQRFGYLHSSTFIDLKNRSYGNFILNVRNGHIFNGKGYSCFVRAVRDLGPSRIARRGT